MKSILTAVLLTSMFVACDSPQKGVKDYNDDSMQNAGFDTTVIPPATDLSNADSVEHSSGNADSAKQH